MSKPNLKVIESEETLQDYKDVMGEPSKEELPEEFLFDMDLLDGFAPEAPDDED